MDWSIEPLTRVKRKWTIESIQERWHLPWIGLQLSSTTVELSQALRERLKERHDSIGLLSRRRCSGMTISPLARSSRATSVQSPASSTSVPPATTTTATSPSMPGVPISPTFNTSNVPVLVTASSFSRASPSSPRLSPVHSTSTSVQAFNASSHPASPEGRSSPIGSLLAEELKTEVRLPATHSTSDWLVRSRLEPPYRVVGS